MKNKKKETIFIETNINIDTTKIDSLKTMAKYFLNKEVVFMKEINSFSEIKDAKININEKFIINKGKRKGCFIIKNHDNFEGCFELFKTDLIALIVVAVRTYP